MDKIPANQNYGFNYKKNKLSEEEIKELENK